MLGMPFSSAHNRCLDFDRPVLLIYGKTLTCTYGHERLLISIVQVTRGMVITL